MIFSNDIKIREFKKSDFDSVTNIIVHSFKNKFYSLAHLSDEMIIQLFKDTGIIEDMPFEGYLVAEKNNAVLGVMLLRWKNQKYLKNCNRLSFLQLIKKYGVIKISKFILGLLLLGKNPDNNECYIEHIAVSSKARGLGIGTKLINYGKDFVKNTPYLNKYTLSVAASNKGAINLYENLGFDIKKSQSSITTQLLLKERDWLYMEHCEL